MTWETGIGLIAGGWAVIVCVGLFVRDWHKIDEAKKDSEREKEV